MDFIDEHYLGLEPTIYTKINGAMYNASNGLKIYGSYRTYFSGKRSSNFYGQGNLGGGYFSESVSYVAEYFNHEDYYAIDRKKQFLAIGGNMQFGYHFLVKQVSIDVNLGVQILKRLLAQSIEFQGTEFRRNIASHESTYSDNMNWGLFGAGSILNASFAIKYNIY